MPFFTSIREKRLWFCVLLVLMAISLTLLFGGRAAQILNIQGYQELGFIGGMLLIAIMIFISGLRIKARKMEMVIWLGLTSVYLLLFVRLSLPERTHLIEYSVLAIFVYQALWERAKHKNQILPPALTAFIITVFCGFLDECIQLFIPSRVFDPRDILFNALSAGLAITTVGLISWIHTNFK